MRHSRFFKYYPRCLDREEFYKMTRVQLNRFFQPPSAELKQLDRTRDPLAFRAYMLSHHGNKSLVNSILMDHGKAKRF